MKKIRILFLCWVASVCVAAASENPVFSSGASVHPGVSPADYRAILWSGETFVAARSDGCIDRISPGGTLLGSTKVSEKAFHCLLAFGQYLVAAGEGGQLWIAEGRGPFVQKDSGTVHTIESLTFFKGLMIAGTSGRSLLTASPSGVFRPVLLDLKGNVLSLSAGVEMCYGVTDAGEILRTRDGIHWSLFDFNREYAGYYLPCTFTSVALAPGRIAVSGTKSDGSPVLMLSTRGNVWTERPLDYSDPAGGFSLLKQIPEFVWYDPSGDQWVLVCRGGHLMTLPACSQCNRLTVLSSEDLRGMAANGKVWMVVGDHSFLHLLPAFFL